MRTKNWVIAVICTVSLSALWAVTASAEAVREECPSILSGGLTSEQLLEKAAQLVTPNEPNGPQFFAKTQDKLDANKLGPIAQTVYDNMGKYLIGHDPLKRAFALAVQSAAQGTRGPNRPAGVFLLGGITGTGKSESGPALAQALGLSKDDVTTIDCGELTQGHSSTRLTGAPPSFKGYDDATLITQELLDSRTSQVYKVNIVLIDELEKADDEIKKLLLGALDKGKMTTSGKDHPKVDYSHTIFILTTNLGQQQMQAIIHGQNSFIGFIPTTTEKNLDRSLTSATYQAISSGLSPEFRNRIDETFVFLPTTRTEAEQILNMRLAAAQRDSFFSNESEKSRILFSVTPKAREYLLDQGFDSSMGGRSVRRLVEQQIEKPLTNLIGSGDLKSGDLVEINVSTDNRHLTFQRVMHGLTWDKQVELYKEFYGNNVPVPEMPGPKEEDEDSYEIPQSELKLLTHESNRNDMTRESAPAETEKGRQKGEDFDNLEYNYSDVRDAAHYKMFLLSLDETPHDCFRLAKMASYIQTSNYFSDQIFIDFLERMPKSVVACGYRKSTHITNFMRKDGIGLELNDPALPLEPYYLTVATLGLRKLTFIQDSRKSTLYDLVGQALVESSTYLKRIQQKVGPGYRTPAVVSKYFDQLVMRAGTLPSSPPKGK